MRSAGHVVRQAGSRKAKAASGRRDDPVDLDAAEMAVDTPSGPPVVLITHGSMNPVHLGHVSMMVRAKAALEAQGRTVAGGVIAITRLSRIQGKGSAAMSNALRLALLDLACGPHAAWLSAADGAHAGSAGEFIKKEAAMLQRRYGACEAVSVEGSDVLLRYPPRAGRKAPPRVVVAREGEEARAADALRRLSGPTLG